MTCGDRSCSRNRFTATSVWRQVPLEDLPKATNAYSGPKRDLVGFNLPLCAGYLHAGSASDLATFIVEYGARACYGPQSELICFHICT